MSSYFVMLSITTPVWWMYGIAVVLALLGGWVVTLYPERLILDGFIQLFQIGKAIYLMVKH